MWWSHARKDASWVWYQGVAWRFLAVTGLGYAAYAAWGAWQGNNLHDAALAAFMTRCSETRAVEACTALVDENDDGCLFASGLLTERPQGQADYERCLEIGEVAYRAQRKAAVRARQQKRRRDEALWRP